MMKIYGALLAIGLLLLFSGPKEKQALTNQWAQAIQWGYILIAFGVFGLLTPYLSFTAILLIFTALTLTLWLIGKIKQAQGKTSGHFVDFLGGFFPIVLVIFIVRTFIAEPFVIPSSSMRPGLIPGDFILANKFTYGIRMPISNQVIIKTGKIERGDVVVFNYPKDPAVNFIKRIIAVGGDTVEYRDKVLSINGKVVEDMQQAQEITPMDDGDLITVDRLLETLDGKTFMIYQVPDTPSLHLSNVDNPHPHCSYDESGFMCTVPQGKYFAMGDNRDNSADSRYWGFVDDQLIVGKAWKIWMNFRQYSRIGKNIR